MTRAELLAALAAATGPDRALDVEIFRAVPGLIDEERCRAWCRMDGRTDLTRDRYIEAHAPMFTTSLDAALTLVPEGMRWLVRSHDGTLSPSGVGGVGRFGFANVASRTPSFGDTPALALCIAALSASAP